MDVLTVWCQKWQLTPNALKCECVVFENTGNTNPVLRFVGETLPMLQTVVYLGYMLSHRGSWKPHVERRVVLAEKWDGSRKEHARKNKRPAGRSSSDRARDDSGSGDLVRR